MIFFEVYSPVSASASGGRKFPALCEKNQVTRGDRRVTIFMITDKKVRGTEVADVIMGEVRQELASDVAEHEGKSRCVSRAKLGTAC